jgi:hypothetical protein
MKTRMAAFAVLGLLTAACATTTTAPRRQFDDIPLPTGLTYQLNRSVMIESPSVRAGQLVYRGRLEPVSLGDVMRSYLESNGWQSVSRTSSPSDTWLIYEKDGKAVEVHIYEKLWYTYMTLSASEVVPPAATASTAGILEPKDGASQTVQLDASATSTAVPASGTTTANQSSEDPTFTEKVKHFFNNLFTW